nr:MULTISPECIES: DUF309 domain-containing protein [Myxococcaceae]
MQEGVRLFNAGAHWEAHEAWEGAWREAGGERRALLHGLILAAAGWVQRGRGREAGAHTLFGRALQRLKGLPADCGGLDVAALRADLEAWRAGDLAHPARVRASVHPSP